MPDLADSYLEAREGFLEALSEYEAATGRSCARARHAIAGNEDCTIDVGHVEWRGGRRLLLVTSGVHGVEGYAGSAIQRALLAGPLRRLAADWDVMLVHAVNPWGMAHFRRVNASNVDLNRNFGDPGSALYRTDNPGYLLIAEALSPRTPVHAVFASQAQLLANLSTAVLAKGYGTLKQALLTGQYTAPAGLFYGGTEPQREARVLGDLFQPLGARYDEILLTDLHTGYGNRGQVLLIFSQAESADVIAQVDRNARGPDGRIQGYVVTGDLVAWCRQALKRINPHCVFNGVVIEVGTTGLSAWTQLRDLGAMVRENQLHHNGARSPAVERSVKTAFREMFWPSDPSWRRDSLAAALAAIEELLARRGCLAN